MAYRLIDHTADLGIEASAACLDELFVECLRALTDCMTRLDRIATHEARTVSLQAPDLERLLVQWLSEAIYRHEAEGLVFAEASVEVGRDETGWRLTGELRGEEFDAERHGLKTLVKAVTYHQLRVRRQKRGWQARVILDL